MRARTTWLCISAIGAAACGCQLDGAKALPPARMQGTEMATLKALQATTRPSAEALAGLPPSATGPAGANASSAALPGTERSVVAPSSAAPATGPGHLAPGGEVTYAPGSAFAAGNPAPKPTTRVAFAPPPATPTPRRTITDPLAEYPHGPLVDVIAAEHRERGRSINMPQPILAVMTCATGAQSAQWSILSSDGTAGSWTDAYSPDGLLADHRDSYRTHVSADELSRAQKWIDQLPETEVPPQDDLLVLSVLRDGQWKTVAYDRRSPPPAARSLFELTGAKLPPVAAATQP